MITLLKKIFIENWIRKIVSIIAATAIWFIVNNSINKSPHFTSINTKIIEDVR